MSNPMSVTRRPVLQRDGTETADDIPEFVTGPDGGHYGHFHAAAGVIALLTSFTSANLRAALTDETGAGAAVFADSPTFTTAVTVERDALATAIGSGLRTINTTPATAPAPVQNAPSYRSQGNAWDLGTLTSKTVDWHIHTIPVSGNPVSARYRFVPFINGVQGPDVLVLDSDGVNSGKLTLTNKIAGGASADGLVLTNPQVADVGNPAQRGPRIKLESQGWDTDDAVARVSGWRIESLPLSGTTVQGSIKFSHQLDGGSFVDDFTSIAGGTFTKIAGNVQLSAGALVARRDGIGAVSTDGTLLQNATLSLVGTPVQYGPRSRHIAHVFNTSTVLDETREVVTELRPVSGSSTSFSYVIARGSGDVAGATDLLTILSSGGITALGGVAGSGVFTATRSGIGAASTAGFLARNPTAALVGTQHQWAPRIERTGTVWDGAASRAVGWIDEVQTTAGASYRGDLVFSYSANGAAYGESVRFRADNMSVFNTPAQGATTPTGGIQIANLTAAALGAQQFSGMLVLTGQGWDTTAGASKPLDFCSQVEPAQTAGNPTGVYRIYVRQNNGAWTSVFRLSQSGALDNLSTITTANGFVATAGNVTASGGIVTGNQLRATAGSFGTTSTDGLSLTNGAISSVGTPVQYAPRLRFLAHALNTTGNTDETQEMAWEMRPASSTTPTATMFLTRNRNGAGFADAASITDGGIFTSNAGSVAFSAPAANGYFSAQRSIAAGATERAFLAANSGAASSGNQRWSSYFQWQGLGWDSTASASKLVDFRAYLVPVQQAGNPSGELTFEAQSNGAGYTAVIKLLSQGGMFIQNNGVDPATPTSGGVLYVKNGALRYKGSSGTDVQLAAA